MNKFKIIILAFFCLGINFINYAQNSPLTTTPEQIFNKSIALTFAKVKPEDIKDIEVTGDGNVFGQELTMMDRYILPSNFMHKIMGGNLTVLYQAKINGKYFMKAQGKDIQMNDELQKTIEAQSAFLPELDFLKHLNDFTLEGVEDLDGQEAYKIKIKSQLPNTEINIFYSVEKGYRLKTVILTDGKVQEINYANYVLFPSGIFYYANLELFINNINLNFNIKSIKINNGFEFKDLAVE